MNNHKSKLEKAQFYGFSSASLMYMPSKACNSINNRNEPIWQWSQGCLAKANPPSNMKTGIQSIPVTPDHSSNSRKDRAKMTQENTDRKASRVEGLPMKIHPRQSSSTIKLPYWRLQAHLENPHINAPTWAAMINLQMCFVFRRPPPQVRSLENLDHRSHQHPCCWVPPRPRRPHPSFPQPCASLGCASWEWRWDPFPS